MISLSLSDKIWIKLMMLGRHTGCHQMAERSFFIKGYQFPVCSRCTGVLIGELIALIRPLKKNPLKRGAVFLIIMFCDWFIQYVKIKESNNRRRLITGIFGGYASWSIYICIVNRIIKVITASVDKEQ
ncbi:MAG: DUF2085 domain-containing protein [Ruminococcus sp.]|nr:DUF2085 domain-containing protein [Ruminococcus sp.]